MSVYCGKGKTVYEIGAMSCKVCDEMIGKGFCNFHKSTRKTLAEKERGITKCGECRAYIPFDEKTTKRRILDKISMGYTGICQIRNISVSFETKACDIESLLGGIKID